MSLASHVVNCARSADEKLHTFAEAKSLQRRLVSQSILPGLHNKSQAGVDTLLSSFLHAQCGSQDESEPTVTSMGVTEP
jgi:hypothetical protein